MFPRRFVLDGIEDLGNGSVQLFENQGRSGGVGNGAVKLGLASLAGREGQH